MSIKSFVSSRLSSFLLNERRLEKARADAESARLRAGERHRIEFFHQVDDPYSYLLAQALLELEERYDVDVVTWLVAPPEDWAAPERARLEVYSLLDAHRVAAKAGFAFEGARLPAAEAVREVQGELAQALTDPQKPGSTAVLQMAVEAGHRLWRQSPLPADSSSESNGSRSAVALRAGTARREKLGHYLGGTCYYGGEWSWGIDRLEYLEERLTSLDARRPAAPAGPIYSQPRLRSQSGEVSSSVRAGGDHESLPDLHFYASFRSPYTYVATGRVIQLAEAYGVPLRIRFVLPMVMRGLPVGRSKRFYILRDAAREAKRSGVPFAPIADPVGRPVERGYSLLPWAIEQGRGAEYTLSFMTHAWSAGVDAGSARGLRRIVEAAGLDWGEARGHLDSDEWQAIAEQNRLELLELGLWGVPSFRVGQLSVWGQDRLWAIEDEYERLLEADSLPSTAIPKE